MVTSPACKGKNGPGDRIRPAGFDATTGSGDCDLSPNQVKDLRRAAGGKLLVAGTSRKRNGETHVGIGPSILRPARSIRRDLQARTGTNGGRVPVKSTRSSITSTWAASSPTLRATAHRGPMPVTVPSARHRNGKPDQKCGTPKVQRHRHRYRCRRRKRPTTTRPATSSPAPHNRVVENAGRLSTAAGAELGPVLDFFPRHSYLIAYQRP